MNAEQLGSRHIDYLDHMLDALRLARSYTDGQKKEDFLEDRKTQQAVILNILIIGEAATKLANEYPEIVSKHPTFPWKQMRGMRNRMAHGYFEINLDIVWETVQQSLPELEQQILQLMQQAE
ncbi:MAG: DUF86 domain-containing protein [Thiobacillus sp.]|nr:DUF86 domain-containing protein [Thiobacillus sp.]